MRQFLFSAGLAVLLSAVAAAPSSASPRDDVINATNRLAEARSYVVHIDAAQAAGAGQIEMQYVAPDRYRMMIPGAPAQTIIGNTAYMEMGGRTMRVPLPAGTLDEMRSQARIREAHDNARIEAAGSEVLDGTPADRYRIVHPDQSGTLVTLWVGKDGLPLQMHVDGPDGDATMRYSRINDPALVIATPD